MKIHIKKSVLAGEIEASPSKSYEQRVLAGALLSKKTCTIKNYGNSDDVLTARNIIKQLGCGFEFENNALKTFPTTISENNTINCNESALCARLFAPITCLIKPDFEITGAKTLLNRQIAEDFEIFEKMGIVLNFSENYKLPISFSKAKLKNGIYHIDGSKSSQLISGLLMSLPLVDGDSELFVNSATSINYILMSIDIAKKFGIKISYNLLSDSDISIKINGNQTYNPGEFEVENDWSGISMILAAGALCGNITVKGLNSDSIQPDKSILEVFNMANVKYSWSENSLNIEKSEIKAFEFDAKNCPDLIPSLVCLALFGNGKSKIWGAERLLNKESSRGEVLLKEFKKIGADIKLSENIIEIIGKSNYENANTILDPHNDHRIAMALTVVGLNTKNGIEVQNAECISKSYPNFFKDIRILTSSS